MKWTKITLSTTSEALDLVCSLLNDLGIEGIEIVDNVPITEKERKAMFIDILPEVDTEDKTARVSFYLDGKDDPAEIMDKLREGLNELSRFVDTGSKRMEVSETEDKDWINNWKAYFKPFRIDDTIVIKPTWEKLEETGGQDLVIEIDPGTAFGTGSHETTKLCILGLKKYLVPDARLLDVGCGSGILSIIGARLGAGTVMATDVDPNAVKAAYDNARVNHIPEKNLRILDGDIITDKNLQQKVGFECYDIVVANILADIIIPLAKEIGRHMKPGGIFISSGIIHSKKEAVKESVVKNGFKIIEINEMGDWVSITAKK